MDEGYQSPEENRERHDSEYDVLILEKDQYVQIYLPGGFLSINWSGYPWNNKNHGTASGFEKFVRIDHQRIIYNPVAVKRR
jgi:hypothetical protein